MGEIVRLVHKARQDEIQNKRDQLIGELESQLQQRVDTQSILVCEWRME